MPKLKQGCQSSLKYLQKYYLWLRIRGCENIRPELLGGKKNQKIIVGDLSMIWTTFLKQYLKHLQMLQNQLTILCT